MTELEFTLRPAVAFGVGTVIGLERQRRQRMAGLRTNALVATGSCLFVLATPLSHDSGSATGIAAQIVSGIGFLAGASPAWATSSKRRSARGARLLGNGRDDAKLERVAAALQRDPALSSVSWKVASHDTESSLSAQAAE